MRKLLEVTWVSACITFWRIFFEQCILCCLSISFVTTSVFSSISSFVLFLWERVSADDPRDIIGNIILFSLCRLLSREAHAGDFPLQE